MRATKRLRLILFRERCHSAPSRLAQPCRSLWVMAERQKHLVTGFRSEARVDQRIRIEREADCGFGLPVRACDLIAAAATEGPDETVGIKRKTEPVLIFESVALGRVQSQAGLPPDAVRDLLSKARSFAIASSNGPVASISGR